MLHEGSRCVARDVMLAVNLCGNDGREGSLEVSIDCRLAASEAG
jgi:hypothetical protein